MSAAFAGWLAMGGYAAFVWPAYGVAALILGAVSFHAWHRHRDSARLLDRVQRQSGARE